MPECNEENTREHIFYHKERMKMPEWNEENIREHMFTEVEVSDSNGIGWRIGHLVGFRENDELRFDVELISEDGSLAKYERMRLIPPKPKSLRITDEEFQSHHTGAVYDEFSRQRFNALVDLVEGKEDV